MDSLVEGVAGMTGYFNIQVHTRGLGLALGLGCMPGPLMSLGLP